MGDQFAEALGNFCWNFSITESTIRSSLFRVAGVLPKLGNAIFTNVRVDNGTQLLTRIAEAKDWPLKKKKELKYTLNQLSLINKLRNDILHYGAYRLSDDYIVSNRQAAHTAKNIREFRISARTLEFAGADLYQIGLRLQLLTSEPPFALEPGIAKAYKASLTSSWQYKQPPPAWSKSKKAGRPSKEPRL